MAHWSGACKVCRVPAGAGICIVAVDVLPLSASSLSNSVGSEYTDDDFGTDGPGLLLVWAEGDDATVEDLTW